MKTQDEVQRAHDLLVGLIVDESELLDAIAKTKHERVTISAMSSVLCWVLDHDHNQRFPEFLDHLEKTLRELGYDFGTVQARSE